MSSEVVEFLFIGGPKNGEYIALDRNIDMFRVPTMPNISYFDVRSEESNIAMPIMEERYRAMKMYGVNLLEHTITNFLVHDSFTDQEAYEFYKENM